MAIGGIFKGIGRIADEIADVPEHVYKQALKDADLKQPPVATSIDDTSEQIAKLSDEEFSALIKEFDQSATPPPIPVAQVDEIENMTDEEFLATLKSFKEEAPQELAPDPNFVDIDPMNMTDAQIEEMNSILNPTIGDLNLMIANQDDIAETFAVYKSGLITKDEFIENVETITGKTSSDKFKTEDILAGKGPKGTVFENPTKVKEYLDNGFNDLDDLQIAILPDEDAIEVAKEFEGINSGETVSMRLALNADDIPDRDPTLPFAGLDPRTGEVDQRVAKTLRAVRGEGMENIPDLIIERLDLLRENPRANMSTVALNRHITDDEIAAIRIDLTEQEMAAVEFYTYRGDTAMNPALREGLVEPGSALDATVQEINRALDKLPNREAVVYRQEGAERFAAYEVGEEITADAFSSFTLSRIGSKTWKDAKANPFSGKKTVIVMQSKTGKYIAPLTHQSFEGEHEVLYKAGQRFRVIDKDEATKQVFLEEIE